MLAHQDAVQAALKMKDKEYKKIINDKKRKHSSILRHMQKEHDRQWNDVVSKHEQEPEETQNNLMSKHGQKLEETKALIT